jgi:hypothetical protein
MSNDLTQNPWVVDTASATPITSDAVRVAKFRWVGGTTAGHECKITNAAGTAILFSSFAAGANHVDEQTHEIHTLFAAGLAVPTLASGKVYIYFK